MVDACARSRVIRYSNGTVDAAGPSHAVAPEALRLAKNRYNS